MGETQNQTFQLSFNKFLRVDIQPARVTSEGGLLVVRELDQRLDLTGLTQNHLVDPRTWRNTQFPKEPRLRPNRGQGDWRLTQGGGASTICARVELKSEIPVRAVAEKPV